MAYEETELKQADQLDRIVENIIQGDCDLFEGVQARRLSHDTMAVVDLATFVMPLEVAEGKEFDQRMCLLAVREAQRLTPNPGLGSRKAVGVWSRFVNPVLGVGLSVAAFCAALFLEPMAVGREDRSIDTFSRPWYNVAMGKYSVVSAYSDAGRLSFFDFSDAASGHGAAACR